MEAAFLKIVNMSITAGWAALAVMLARLLFKKAPKGLLCCLWALVALRLVLPFSFESVISLIPSTETLPQEFLFAATPEIESGIPVLNNTLNPIISQSLAPDPLASANPTQVLSFVFARLWILGMLVMALYTLISYLRIRRRVRASLPQEGSVYLCDDIETPFILGILRPRIYLPGTMEEQTRAHVLAHEYAHLKRLDHLWKPLGFLLLTVHWFNPILWIAYILLCRDMELACDERVIRNLGTEEKKAYSLSLLQCSVHRPVIGACPLAFGEVGVKQRIQSVLHYRKPAFWVLAATMLLCAALTLCFLTDPIPPSVFDITEGRGYTVLTNCPQSLELTIPCGRFTEEAFTQEGLHFKEREIIAYQSDTTTIWLSNIMRSNESEALLYFTFDISYDFPTVGTILASQVSVYESHFRLNTSTLTEHYRKSSETLTESLHTFEDAVSLRGEGPGQQFVFYVNADVARRAEGDLRFCVTMNQLTYAKNGHAPKLHNGKTNVDKSYINWVFDKDYNYEPRLNDLGMIAFAQPYQAFAAMTMDFADAIAYLMDTHDLDPIEPFRFEAYKLYGAQTQTTDTKLNQACMAVSQILSIYENSFKDATDPVDTPITQARIIDGVYHSGAAAFWNPLSSWFYQPGDMMMTVDEGEIRVGNSSSLPHTLLWQTTCPIGENQLAEFYKVYGSTGMTLDDRCVYQPIDDTTFLAKQDDRIYLVNWTPGAEPVALIWYIVEMQPE